MQKRLSHCSFRFESDFAPQRRVWMAPERPMDDAQRMKQVVEIFTSPEIAPAKMIRPSAPHLKTVDEYPKDAEGHIMHPFLNRRLSDAEIAQQREWDKKLPAIYRMDHDVPPEEMPSKLELPPGKELYVFGGEHNAKGVVDKMSNAYPANKMNFYPGQSLDEMVTKAKALGDQVPKEQLKGATATVMVDPDVFFGDKDAKSMEAALKELCKTLKDYGMQVTVSTAPPIGDYFYDKGGPADFGAQKADWKKTEAARDKRSVFNELVRKLYLGKESVDKVLEADVGFSFYKDSSRIHPDYRSNNAYLNGAGLDLAAKIFAAGINKANGVESVPGVAPKIVPTVVSNPDVTPIDYVPEFSADIPETVTARLEKLVQIVKELREGKADEKPSEEIAKIKNEIQWAKDQGVEVEQIAQLDQDFQKEIPKVLLKFAEARLKTFSDAYVKPSAYEVHQAILAIEEAEKAGADKEKVVELKKAVGQYV